MPEATFTELVERVVTKDPVARKVGDAMRIDQRKISATRITTGTLAAETITLGESGVIDVGVGGEILAGGASISDQGLQLISEFSDNAVMWPGNTAADWLTGPTGTNPAGSGPAVPYAGLAFFNQLSPSSQRGLILEAIGVVTTSKVGKMILRVTDGVTSGMAADASTAYIDLEAGSSGAPGTIRIKGDTTFISTLTATGQIDFNAVSGTIPWLQGGYKENALSPGGQWSLQTTNASVKRISNFVFLSGRFTNSSGTTNTPGSVITDLGADFTPAQDKVIVVPQTTGGDYVGQCRIRIASADGNVLLAADGAGSANEVNPGQSVSLDGVCFAISN